MTSFQTGQHYYTSVATTAYPGHSLTGLKTVIKRCRRATMHGGADKMPLFVEQVIELLKMLVLAGVALDEVDLGQA